MIRAWPDEARFNFGGEFDRLEARLEPLDFGSMGAVLPGVYELRHRDAECWYRVLYIHLAGLIYVRQCFTKKTNQTSPSDIKTARDRLTHLNQEIRELRREKKLGKKKHC